MAKDGIGSWKEQAAIVRSGRSDTKSTPAPQSPFRVAPSHRRWMGTDPPRQTESRQGIGDAATICASLCRAPAAPGPSAIGFPTPMYERIDTSAAPAAARATS